MVITHKPEVGEQLFLVATGRYNEQQYYVDVVKVGRKYFTVNKSEDAQSYYEQSFHISDWRHKTDYSANLFLYNSKQEWEDKKEHDELSRKIYSHVQYSYNMRNIPLDNIRKIVELLGIGDLCQ